MNIEVSRFGSCRDKLQVRYSNIGIEQGPLLVLSMSLSVSISYYLDTVMTIKTFSSVLMFLCSRNLNYNNEIALNFWISLPLLQYSFCGKSMTNNTITSSTNRMFLNFKTNKRGQRKGFNIKIILTDKISKLKLKEIRFWYLGNLVYF